MDGTGETLVFGWRTALLALASLQIAVLAFALATAPANRLANRFLAAFLVVLIGVLTPYTIGFAGFYDRWPGLSYAPFATPLLLGPLIWAYAHALTRGAPPARLWLHLLPGIAQFAYGLFMVLQPLEVRNRWDDGLGRGLVEPVLTVWLLAGLAAYCAASILLLLQYRTWLAGERSDDNEFAARWLYRVLGSVLAVLAVWIGFKAWDLAVASLDYFGMFPLYLVLAALGGYLAVEGWRHGSRPFPAMPDAAAMAEGEGDDAARWRELAEGWAARTRAEGWAHDAELGLASLAARLGTNTGYLSRAVNQGLGMNFSTFINGIRSEEVARAIDEGKDADLLALALEAGFASKASFNRGFRARYGMSPSDYRAMRCGSKAENSRPPEVLRRAEP